MRPHRLLVVAAVLVALVPAAAAPASAATKATHVATTVDLATVHVGSPFVVSGKASPVRAGATVTLQRFNGKAWRPVGHQKSSAAGTFAFRLKAPKTAGTWLLRVVRAAGGGTKAGVGATLHVRVVKPIFAVSAKAALTTTYGQVLVTGKVSPRTTGGVRLQRLSGKTWVTVGKATPSKAGTFSATAMLASAGPYSLRVVKPFNTTTAQGISKTLHVTIPLPDPTVATTTLPRAVVGRPYTTALAATLGVGPYTWSVAGLPAGLTASTAGVISGTTTLPGVFPLAAAVTDARGRTGVTALSLSVAQTHVLAWGWDASGQVGDGGTDNVLTAVPVQGIDAVTQIAGISGFALMLRADGTVWGLGDDVSGELGLGPVTTAPHPTPVPGITSAVAVAAGQGFGLILTADGTVWGSGSNGGGQLADGTTTSRRTYSPVLGLGRAVSIAAGINDGYALLADGTVWGWGVGNHGELGPGTTSATQLTPVPVVGVSGVRSIAASGQGGYALLADGTVRAWGRNNVGQLGNGTFVDSPSPVVVTGLSGVASLATNLSGGTGYAVKTDGTVWAWGYNVGGAVGDGTRTNRTIPAQVAGVTNALAISPGLDAAYVPTADGRLLEWGEGSSGALATGNELRQLLPIATPGVSGVVAASGGEATGYAIVAG